MGTYKNLTSTEGIEKMKEIVAGAETCMFTSNLASQPVSARPMSTSDVDEDGNLWFFSEANSNKNTEIAADNRVQLFYSNKTANEYLNVYGYASVIHDKEKAKELWSRWIKTWFTEGVDDPELTLIKVIPEDIYYWDTQHNKMISQLKIAIGSITGKTMDDGVEGSINY